MHMIVCVRVWEQEGREGGGDVGKEMEGGIQGGKDGRENEEKAGMQMSTKDGSVK